jgi:hypothetical protein
MIFKTYSEDGKKNNNLIMDMIFLIVAVGLVSIILSLALGIVANTFITGFEYDRINLYYSSAIIAVVTYLISFFYYFKSSKVLKVNPNS